MILLEANNFERGNHFEENISFEKGIFVKSAMFLGRQMIENTLYKPSRISCILLEIETLIKFCPNIDITLVIILSMAVANCADTCSFYIM